MKRTIGTAAALAAILIAPAAMAQDSAMQEAPATADAAQTAAITDAELEQFTRAALRVRDIQADATITDKATAMQEVVSNSGLEPARFNTIATAVQSDTAVQARFQPIAARVQQEMMANQAAPTTTQPAPAPATPAAPQN